MSARPRVGISAYWVQARWGAWDLPAALLPQGYVEGVRLAGGVPLLLPPTPEGAEQPGEVLDGLDGVVLTGGPDLDAALYGAAPHEQNDPRQERRDPFELALLTEARRRGMPVLGICRGMQLLNVASGGDLVQHLAESVDMTPHRPQVGTFGTHDVSVEGDSLAGSLLGERVSVQSHHHQGIGRVGAGLTVTAHAEDGTIEGLEDPSADFCVGVLWHPEERFESSGAPLFTGLVEAARRYRQRTGEGAT